MSAITTEKAEDRAILMDFYQLKTLSPKDYENDTIQSNLKIDLSTEDLTKIPKDVVNRLLGDNSNESNVPKDQLRPTSTRKPTTGRSGYSDPLGYHSNILDELIDKDILDDTRDPQLNKYIVDSKLFNPKLFLSVIHSDKSLNELLIGIKNLESDIESKKPLLQALISDNFEKTLNSKNSLDKIFNEFSGSIIENEITSLNSSLASSNNSTNQLLNPVLLKLSKEQELANTLAFVRKNKFFLDLPRKLQAYVDEDDFDSVLQEYKRGYEFFKDIKAEQNKNSIFDKIWATVENVTNNYIESMTAELNKIYIDLIGSNFQAQVGSNNKNFITLIKRIIQLKPKENPVKNFIQFQYRYIMEDLDKGIAKINFELLYNSWNAISNVYQNNTVDSSQSYKDNVHNYTLSNLLRVLGSSTFDETHLDTMFEKLDSQLIIHIWRLSSLYVSNVTEDVVEKKILRFESVVEYFIKDFNKLLSAEPGEKFVMEEKDLKEMKEYFSQMTSKICERLKFVFTCSKTELLDVMQQSIGVGGTKAVLPKVVGNLMHDMGTFGYIPPNSNSISTLCFSFKFFKMINDKLTLLKNNDMILNSQNISNTIDTTIKTINKSIIKGCVCTFVNDIRQITLIDNVQPNEAIEGASRLVTFVQNYYKIFTTKLHQLYIFEDADLKSTLEKELLSSFDILAEGMMNNMARFRDSPKFDYYYLVTIYNFRNLSQSTIPAILKSFDLNFDSNLSKRENLKIFEDIDNYEYTLFAEYMKEPLKMTKAIVQQGFATINSTSEGAKLKLLSKKSIEMSDYILKSINHTNTMKSRLLNFKIRKSFILDVQSSLMSQLQKKLVDNLGMELSDDAKYQLALDINVLLLLFQKFNSNAPQSNIISTKQLEKAYTLCTSNIDVKILDQSRDENVNSNYTQFMEFVK